MLELPALRTRIVTVMARHSFSAAGEDQAVNPRQNTVTNATLGHGVGAFRTPVGTVARLSAPVAALRSPRWPLRRGRGVAYGGCLSGDHGPAAPDRALCCHSAAGRLCDLRPFAPAHGRPRYGDLHDGGQRLHWS